MKVIFFYWTVFSIWFQRHCFLSLVFLWSRSIWQGPWWTGKSVKNCLGLYDLNSIFATLKLEVSYEKPGKKTNDHVAERWIEWLRSLKGRVHWALVSSCSCCPHLNLVSQYCFSSLWFVIKNWNLDGTFICKTSTLLDHHNFLIHNFFLQRDSYQVRIE